MPPEIVVATAAAILLLITGQTILASTSADRQQDLNSGGGGGGDGGVKSLNIELIKLSILNKLGMQRPPEFGNRLSLQAQSQKYNNKSGSSTVTMMPPQFRNNLYRINATENNTINSHNGDDDDDYHVQTQKLIAFTQPRK